MTDFPGSPSPLSQPLLDTDLHIWYALLEGSPEELSRFFSVLSPDEKARAERFYFERDRNRYIFGRGILRTLLSSYLGVEVSRIVFIYGPYGKPALETEIKNKALKFNLSHSHDRAVYIFGWDRLVGIDLEHIRPMQNADDFAERFFSARESALINSLSGDKKWDAFFKLWTCKEAFLKANGSGLSVPLNQAEVSLNADGSATLTSIGGDSEQAILWRLVPFNPVINYQAAIAVEEHESHEGKVIFQNYNNSSS